VVGDRDGEVGAWETLGDAQHHLGNEAEAFACYRRSIGMYRELGEQYLEAETLTHLGDRHHDTGDRQAAGDAWQQALAVLTALNHPNADAVRTKPDQLDAGRAAEQAPKSADTPLS